MAKAIASKFYKSKAWQNCRAAYLAKQGGLCERCLAKGLLVPAEIVHHKEHLTENNYQDPDLALSFDNLEALCFSCHNAEHFAAPKKAQRYRIENGKLIY